MPLTLDTLYTVEVLSGLEDLTGLAAVPFQSFFRSTAVPSGGQTLPSVSDEAFGLDGNALDGTAVDGAGDLNGDGFHDIIAGAPGDPIGANPATARKARRWSTWAVLIAAERVVADLIFEGVTAHDRAGVSVAGDCDLNDDGFLDLVIGAEQFNRSGANDTGCDNDMPCGDGLVYVIYFDPTDATLYPNLGDPNTPDTLNLADVGGTIPGAVYSGTALGDRAGFAVHCGGDADGDGVDDLLIGAPGTDPVPIGGGAPETDGGVIYVIFGDAAR